MRFFLAGAAISVGATFPLAALMALVFRFPIPFGAYMSGIGAVIPAPFAAAFFCATFATLAALPGVLILSILDWLIGPW